MADSIREQIVQAILARLETITVSSGYETTLGRHVERTRRSFDDDELPAAAVWPGEEISTSIYTSINHVLTLDIEAHAEVGIETADAAVHRLLADVRKCVEAEDATLDALIDGVRYVQSIPQYPDDGGSLASMRVRFEIKYHTGLGDPYTSP